MSANVGSKPHHQLMLEANPQCQLMLEASPHHQLMLVVLILGSSAQASRAATDEWTRRRPCHTRLRAIWYHGHNQEQRRILNKQLTCWSLEGWKKISPADPWKGGKLPQITAGARELWQKREERASSEEEKRSLQSFSQRQMATWMRVPLDWQEEMVWHWELVGGEVREGGGSAPGLEMAVRQLLLSSFL